MSLRQAMVLAAGYGKRLRPLTVYFAKPSIPLLGRPILEYTLRGLSRRGLEHVYVNLHYRAEGLEPSLERGAEGLTIHRSYEPDLLGTAGGLKRLEPVLASETFLLLNGDTLVDFDLDRLLADHRRSKAEATLLLRAKPSGTSYSGVRLDEEGWIRAIEPHDFPSDLMFAGVWVLEPSVFARLSGRPAGLETELLPKLIEERTAFGSVAKGDWVTIDTPERYWMASLIMARGGLFEEDWLVRRRPLEVSSSRSARLLAGEHTEVGEGVRLRGGVVLGARCRVGARASLQNVVCWDDVHIPSGTTLVNAVLTHGVRLPAGEDLSDKLVMRHEASVELRKREIRHGLVIASLKTGRRSEIS
jgi:NDP-sugar pyrophosphorylase family protein